MNEKTWSVETLSARHRKVGLDSNILIYLLDDTGHLGELAGALVDAIDDGRLDGMIASIGIVEALTGPARSGDGAAFERAADEIRSLRVDVVGLDASIAEDAARLRGGQPRLGLQDAVHLASARAVKATAFITNDRRIGSIPQLEVYLLDRLDLGDSVR